MTLRLPLPRLASRTAAAGAARLAALPPYQVALWPDGWDRLDGGAVLVRDTDAMAEARRWYRLAELNRAAVPLDRAMRLHGTYVPRAIVALSGRRFDSGETASVAVQLVAGDWVRQRRQRLLADPKRALRERELSWSGSRSAGPLDRESLAETMAGLFAQCVREGLIPDLRCRLRVEPEDGFGVSGFRCTLEVALDPYARDRLAETLKVALVPWNRAVVREGRAFPVIGLKVRAPEPRPRRSTPSSSP